LKPGETVIFLINDLKEKLPLSDIYCLLMNALGREKEFLFSHPEYTLSTEERRRWNVYKERRLSGEPCAYITGYREFYSLLFRVNRYTMIPRPETELLVEEVILLKPKSLLDVGTGCGNIAVASKYYHRECRVVAVDVSDQALHVARENALRILGVHDVIFLKSNYLDNVPQEEFEVIVSNPPYVMTGEISSLQEEIKGYEPRLALDGGPDGLSAYRFIIADSKSYLKKGGKLVLEIDERLVEGIGSLASEYNYIIEKTVKDLAGKERMIVLEK
jgi:release factor glutamine methyltransferase